MKNHKLLTISIASLVIGTILAGCASMRLDYLEPNATGPKQVRQGTDINPKDITVWGIYKDGSRKVVSVGNGNITFNKHTPGIQTVKVRVGVLTSQEVSFQTEVMALRRLSVASQPRTALFKQGVDPDRTWPGLEIRGEWDQMGSDKVDLKLCEITGFMKNQAGKQTIKVSFEGITTTFDVDVRAMSSIQIANQPTKLDYVQGESLDLIGLKVTGVWDGFPVEELEITVSDISGFNSTNASRQRLTITKNGKSVDFNIEVLGLSRIEVDVPPAKRKYKVGEPIDLTGIVVMGHYTSSADLTKSKVSPIPVDQITITSFDTNNVGDSRTVRISVKGITTTFFVDVIP